MKKSLSNNLLSFAFLFAIILVREIEKGSETCHVAHQVTVKINVNPPNKQEQQRGDLQRKGLLADRTADATLGRQNSGERHKKNIL